MLDDINFASNGILTSLYSYRSLSTCTGPCRIDLRKDDTIDHHCARLSKQRLNLYRRISHAGSSGRKDSIRAEHCWSVLALIAGVTGVNGDVVDQDTYEAKAKLGEVGNESKHVGLTGNHGQRRS